MKIFRRLSAALLALCIAVLLLPPALCASGTIETDRDCALTITYADGETSLSGASFSIYRIAEVDAYGEFTTTPDFSGFNVDIKGNNDEAWRTLASTLEGYVLRDSITPTDKGKTDSQGILSFPTGETKLKTGLYLVLGERHTQNNTAYEPSPFIVMLPTTQANDWAYSQTVEPKFTSTPIPPTPSYDYVNRKVLKIWNDAGYENLRPQSVTVQLLRSGYVYDTVTLSDENNWRYEWNMLDNSYSWTVVEELLPNYSVSIYREGITFVVTNSYTQDIPDDPPKESDDPDEIEVPPDEPTPDQPEDPTSDEPILPQTGQLWWPVPVLSCGGLLCIALGVIRRRG